MISPFVSKQAAKTEALPPMDFTSLMPGEIALHIFKFLTLEDATHVGQANWYWANAARAERRCVALLLHGFRRC